MDDIKINDRVKLLIEKNSTLKDYHSMFKQFPDQFEEWLNTEIRYLDEHPVLVEQWLKATEKRRFKFESANFPTSEHFSKAKRVLYLAFCYDTDGLEELAKQHQYVVGIDRYIRDNPDFETPASFDGPGAIQFDSVKYENFLKRVKNKEYPNLAIAQMDAKQLEFADGYFDGVIFKRSLACVAEETIRKPPLDIVTNNEEPLKDALKEANRVLCDNGLLWVIYSIADLDSDVPLFLYRGLERLGFETLGDAQDNMVCRKVHNLESNTSFLGNITRYVPFLTR